MTGPRRFPSRVYDEGAEPDARFSFANERTFLAWIRTSLALIAGGVALEAFGLQLQPQLRTVASLILMLVGIGVPVYAWFGWERSERALRSGLPLPSPLLSAPLGAAVAAVGTLIMLAAVLA